MYTGNRKKEEKKKIQVLNCINYQIGIFSGTDMIKILNWFKAIGSFVRKIKEKNTSAELSWCRNVSHRCRNVSHRFRIVRVPKCFTQVPKCLAFQFQWDSCCSTLSFLYSVLSTVTSHYINICSIRPMGNIDTILLPLKLH